MKSTPLRVRGLFLVCVMACGFTLISGRLVYLQLVSHDHYREKSVEMHYERFPVSPARGKILDRNGRVLAQTATVTDLRIDGKLALEDASGLTEVARLMGKSPQVIMESLSPERRWQLIAEELSESEIVRWKSLGLRWIILEERYRRFYPNGREGSHVLGFTNVIEKTFPGQEKASQIEAGMQGVERVMNKYLAGIPGEQRIVKDAGRKEIAAYRQIDRRPLDGLDVVLSLDQGVQHILETEADRIVKQFSPDSLSIIAVRPATGEILGLTNRPTFDPNDTRTRQPVRLKNRALMDVFEPGSVFKIATFAAVLNEGIVDLSTPVFCENGEFFYANRYLRDSHPYGKLSAKEAFEKSSNIAFAKMALQMRPYRFYRYIRQMGFGRVTQNEEFALEGEEPGLLRPANYWERISMTRIPIGYEIATTNLQMSMAVAAIANNGKLMEPRFIQSVQNKDGQVVKQFLPKVVRQVVRSDVCQALKRAMVGVVEEGTGRSAAVPGLQLAGKTGTARKVINGQYMPGAYCSSFIGFFPAEEPEVLISVVVDYPKGDKYYASQVAAPVFGKIAERVARHLDVFIQEPEPVLTVRRDQ